MKLFILLCACLFSLLAVDAFACQKYSNVVQDANGTVLSGTTVIVKLAGQSGNATIYSDALCSVVQSNPFVNGSDGYFTFYSKNARLDISFSKTGFTFGSSNTSDLYVSEPLIGAGRLTYVGATSIQFCPFNGNYVHIPNGVTKSYNIPAGCVTGTNTATVIDGTGGSNLAASTVYYVYLFDNSGTLTMEFSTTSHATDAATGVEVKTSNATRALIGLIRTNASSQFANSATNRFVSTYFNRRSIGGTNAFTANRTTSSATFVEINTEIRSEFLTWADESVLAAVNGSGNVAASVAQYTSLGFDGITAEDASSTYSITGATYPIACTVTKTGLAEGYHYVTVLGHTNGSNAGTWVGSATLGERTSLNILTRG